MAKIEGDFIWYELMTGDVPTAKAFYGPLLGWDFGMHPGGTDYTTFTAGSDGIGGMMAITPEMAAGGARPVWVSYISAADVDAKAADVAKAGGSVIMQPWDIPGVGRAAFLADPSGAPFYILAPSNEADESRAFARHEPREGACAWNELVSADQPGAHDFYTGQFGWEKTDTMDMGPMGAYDMYSVNGYTLGAIMAKPEEMPASLWLHYFRVADIDVAAEYVAANAGQVVNGPMEIPGGEFIIHGTDPQGAFFALIGKRKDN